MSLTYPRITLGSLFNRPAERYKDRHRRLTPMIFGEWQLMADFVAEVG
jgi:hypothetical protein